MKRVAIIGLGLMGGSLGLDLRRLGLAKVSAFARRGETRKLALELGAADTVHDTPQGAIHGANLVVLCTPVCTMPQLVRDCMTAFEPGCVVTDVGSTKAELVREMSSMFQGKQVIFVGSHPMAGSEKTGMESAIHHLYDGAVTAITPEPGTPEEGVQSVAALWTGVGSTVVRLTPREHDAMVARTSHLPHLAAALLVATATREPALDCIQAFCGPGFRDATRIASGSPEMWHDIVKTNRGAILEELQSYGQSLGKLIGLIEQQDYSGVRELLEQARQSREKLLKKAPKSEGRAAGRI